jgi:hypothetical protein
LKLTVRELQALLKPLDQDAYVVLQGDQEGNSYNYIRGIEEDMTTEIDDEFIFLGQYESLADIEGEYGDDLAFFSIAILYP